MSGKAGHFVTTGQTVGEFNDWTFNDWMCRPDFAPVEKLLMVRATMRGRCCHPFHVHPHREEIIHVVSGKLEQWVGAEYRILLPGEIAIIPAGVVHAAYNPHDEEVTFHAILSPAILPAGQQGAPDPLDVSHLAPWATLREGLPPCSILRDLVPEARVIPPRNNR